MKDPVKYAINRFLEIKRDRMLWGSYDVACRAIKKLEKHLREEEEKRIRETFKPERIMLL